MIGYALFFVAIAIAVRFLIVPSLSSSSSCPAQTPIFFLRIPKTASTFVLSATHAIGDRHIEMLPDWPGVVPGKEKLHDVSAASLARFSRGVEALVLTQAKGGGGDGRLLMAGHVLLPAWDRFARENCSKPVAITFLREPIERLASQYNYDQSGARSARHQANVRAGRFGNTSLGECAVDAACAKEKELERWCSLQTRMLCGTHADCDRGGRAMLDRAIANAFALAHVGIAELMTRSLRHLEHVAEPFFAGVTSRSVAIERRRDDREEAPYSRNWRAGASNTAPRTKQGAGTMSAAATKALEALCALDLELYRRYFNRMLA